MTCSGLYRTSAAAALIVFSQAAHGQPTQSNPSEANPKPAPVGNQETTTAATAPDAATSKLPTAAAETNPPNGEIIVTAQRREQQLQRVPLTVTALSAAQLENVGVRQIVQLSAIVPNVAVRVQANGIQLYMRGVGANTGASPGDEPSIATYIDGMYNPFGASVAAYNLPSIQRVEVLKGPQGTLFGRNSTGGVIQIITKDPSLDTVTGDASIGYGSYETIEAKGYLSVPLARDLAVGLSLYENKQGKGFGHNITLGNETFRHDDTDVRGKFLWSPGPSTQVRVIGEFQHYHSDAPQFQLAQGVVSFLDHTSTYPGKYNTQGNYNELNRLNDYSASGKLDQDLGTLHFADQATYRYYQQETRQDLDTTKIPYLNADLFGKARVFTNEAQLFGPKHSNLDWVIGAYYFHMNGGYDPFHEVGLATGSLPFLDVFANQTISSFALYGQATYTIAGTTHVTVGLRDTWEKHELSGRNQAPGGVVLKSITQSEKSTKPTWRFALAHDFTPTINGYVSYNRGIKSGGYSMTSPFTQGYQPEQLDAYEAGIKAQLFNNFLTFNPAVFHYNYKNIQVRQLFNSSNIITNAAAAQTEGFDFDYSIRPGGGFNLSGGFGYLWKAKFTDYKNALGYFKNGGSFYFDATGNRLVNAPKFTASSEATYQTYVSPGTKLLFALGAAYESSSFTQSDNRFKYNAHLLFNSSVTLDWKRYEARLWMNNITNAEYYSYRSEGTFGDFQVRGEPREVGVTFGVHF